MTRIQQEHVHEDDYILIKYHSLDVNDILQLNRDGWLHKGITVLSKKPEVFNDKYATDTLGIGKNMVDALRYWLIAAGLAVDERKKVRASDETVSNISLTPLGKLLFKKDRFIEEDISLWVIHYQLASNKAKATTWYWLFNKLPVARFDGQLCLNYLLRWVDQFALKKKPNMSSLQKDVSCVLRTYTKAHSRRRSDVSPEDSFECPLASLQLVDYLENSDSFKLNSGKRLIPIHAFAYAVLQFMKLGRDEALVEIGFQDLLSAEGSPGRIFLLSAEGLLSNIDTLIEEFPKEFSFSKTAGLNTLRLRKPDVKALDLLAAGYKGMGN